MKSASPRLVRTVLLGLVLLNLAGCVTKSQDGDASVFRFEMWVPLSAGVGAIVGTIGGFFLRRHSARLGYGLLILGPLALIFLVPGLAMDNLRVDSQKFRLETGTWFARNIHEVKFDEVAWMEMKEVEKWSGRRRSKSTFLVCHLKSGGSRDVPVGDLMKNGGLDAIVSEAAKRGIRLE